MDIQGILLVSGAIVFGFVQLMKKTKAFTKINDWIEWLAIIISFPVVYVLCMANDIEFTVWTAAANGFIVGFNSIGMYKTGDATPVITDIIEASGK